MKLDQKIFFVRLVFNFFYLWKLQLFTLDVVMWWISYSSIIIVRLITIVILANWELKMPVRYIKSETNFRLNRNCFCFDISQLFLFPTEESRDSCHPKLYTNLNLFKCSRKNLRNIRTVTISVKSEIRSRFDISYRACRIF